MENKWGQNKRGQAGKSISAQAYSPPIDSIYFLTPFILKLLITCFLENYIAYLRSISKFKTVMKDSI